MDSEAGTPFSLYLIYWLVMFLSSQVCPHPLRFQVKQASQFHLFGQGFTVCVVVHQPLAFADSVGGSFVSTPAEQAMGDEKGLSMFLYYPSVPMPGLSIHNPSSSTVAAKLAAGCSGVDEEIYGRDFRNLLTRCDASLESQNTQCNIPPILSSPAVNFCSWESLNPRPVAVSKKTAKVSGVMAHTH